MRFEDDKDIDILLVDNNEDIADIFKVLTKKFDLTIKFAKNTEESVRFSKIYSFRFVLCDLNLDYILEGFFISRFFSAINKMNKLEIKIVLFSNEKISHEQMINNSFDYQLEKRFSSIYTFLEKNFSFRSSSKELSKKGSEETCFIPHSIRL